MQRLEPDVWKHTSPVLRGGDDGNIIPLTRPWRRGKHFGTIMVDLERHHVLALLADRSSSSVAHWLRAHPTIAIICRDRGGVFAEGIRQGAPHAQQVSDRFHLVVNLRDALERFCLRHRQWFAAKPAHVPTTTTVSRQRREQTTARWYRVQALHQQGTSITAIARQLHLSRPTIYRYVALSRPPERRHHRRPTPADVTPYVPYILQRWNAGCRNAQQIYREVVAQGCQTSRRTVERFVGELRRETGTPFAFKTMEPAALYTDTTSALRQPVTPLHVARLLVARPNHLLPAEQEHLAAVLAVEPLMPRIYDVVQQFCQMVRQRHGHAFDHWLGHVEQLGVAELQSFAKSLRKDEDAVRAGLTLPWSNGPTEGYIQRLKGIKRQGYGRGGIDWLRRRVVA